MLSLRSLDPLSGVVNSLTTTAADSIVSRLLSEDSVAPAEPSVLDISLEGVTNLLGCSPALGLPFG